jgi:hypothetical protein
MRPAPLLAVLAAVVAGSLVAAGAAPAAKTLPSNIYVDRSGGYRITVPKTWQIVPPSAVAVKQIVAKLKKQKKTELATVYSDMIATAAGRKELSSFRFRAFRWPLAPSPVPTDVTVTIQPIPQRYKEADLPQIGASFASDLRTPGAKVNAVQMLKLPAGRAALITGTVPLPKEYGGIATGFTLILLLKPGKLYLLSFRIDSRAAGDAKLFVSMANLFRFCPAKGSCNKA